MLLEMALTKVVIVAVAGGFSKLQLSRSFHQPHSNARDTERKSSKKQSKLLSSYLD